jgi:hypothetical protein
MKLPKHRRTRIRLWPHPSVVKVGSAAHVLAPLYSSTAGELR